jgi:HlyD family secretion protein
LKSKMIKAIIAGVVVTVISIGGYFGYKTVFAKKEAVTSAQFIASTVKTVNLEVNVQGTGAAYSATTKEVMPNNNGILDKLSLKIGDTVTEGQQLFTSSNDDLGNAVTAAQNSVSEANLNLSNAEKDLSAKQNALAAAEAAATTVVEGNQGDSQSSKSIDDYKSEVEKAKLTVEQNKLKVNNAKNNLENAKAKVNKMTVTAPIGGLVTAVNNSNGDNVQEAKSVITIVDMTSIKIKVSIDELDIEKIKLGQTAQIKFDAIKDKSYEGTVETIAQIGTSNNNVTTYDVIVGITNPEGIKLGMNANVTIQVENKENALVIPAEALVESNGKKFVRVEDAVSTKPDTSTDKEANNAEGNTTEAASVYAQGQIANGQTKENLQRVRNGQGTKNPQSGNAVQGVAASGRLVEIKTGLENENYIEVTEGLTEGQKVLITLPQTNSNSTTNVKNIGGFGVSMPAGGSVPPGGVAPSGGKQRN